MNNKQCAKGTTEMSTGDLCCVWWRDKINESVILCVFLPAGDRFLLLGVVQLCSLVRVASTTTSRNTGSLGFPGYCGSRDAPPIDRYLFCTDALLGCALDRWRRGGEFYRTSFEKHRQIRAQLTFRLEPYSLPGQPPVADVLVTRSSRSCGRWFLTHWRYPQSALGRWRLRFLAYRWPHRSSYGRVALRLSPMLFSSNWSNF